MKENLNNLRGILKYSDGEPFEFVLAFVRIIVFPYLCIASLSLPWWLAIISAFVGFAHVHAISKRCIDCRHRANFISFIMSVMICLIVGREYDFFHFQFVISASVWILAVTALMKTNFQIIKGSSRYGNN